MFKNTDDAILCFLCSFCFHTHLLYCLVVLIRSRSSGSKLVSSLNNRYISLGCT